MGKGRNGGNTVEDTAKKRVVFEGLKVVRFAYYRGSERESDRTSPDNIGRNHSSNERNPSMFSTQGL